MNLILQRSDFLSTGIFGTIESEDESFSLFTLEHAFAIVPDSMAASTNYAPKIPTGSYNCQRGLHTLEHHPVPFEAFEVMDVPNHTKILFHIGNFNHDSDGCILLGLSRDGDKAVLQSESAFNLFMSKQFGINEFTLTVS